MDFYLEVEASELLNTFESVYAITAQDIESHYTGDAAQSESAIARNPSLTQQEK